MEQDYEKLGYLLEDFRLFHLRDAQGTAVNYHYHEFHKLLLLRSGSGSYCVDGKRYALMPGDIVRVGSRAIHRPEFQAGVPYERTILYISREFLQSHQQGGCDLERCFAPEQSHVLRLSEKCRQKIFSPADSLEKELAGSRFGREIRSRCLLLELLVEVGRALESEESLAPMESKNSRILEILRYLDTHLTEEISIDSLSQQFFLSKYHMMRLFKRETGCTVHEYVTDRRLLFARDSMAEGMSAADACFSSGWHSYSSFVRAYSKRFGTSPTGRQAPAVSAEETYE